MDSPRLSRTGLVAVLLGAALAPTDMFVVNVALPGIRTGLATSASVLEWVVAAYGLGFALLLVVGGRLGDAHGRRRLFLVGLAGFTATSLACGLAPSATVLVLARAGQGASAAMLVPQALAIIQVATSGDRRARALGWYGATGGLAMIVGQLAGGLLVEADVAGTGWRPVFLVNVPIGLLAAVLVRRCVPESVTSRRSEVDVAGTVAFGVALLALLVPLLTGEGLGWPPWCRILPALAVPALAVLWRVEARRERAGRSPLLPPSLLRLAAVRTGLAVALLFFVVLGGFLFVEALVLQDDLRLGPLLSGVALAPLGGGFLALSLLARRLVERYGRGTVGAGGALMAGGLGVLAATVGLLGGRAGALALAPGTLLLGTGLGAVSPTLFRIVLAGVPDELAGAGSGMLATTQQVATATGVATLGSAFVALRPAGATSAFVVVLGVAMLLAVGVAVLARRLPDPRVADHREPPRERPATARASS